MKCHLINTESEDQFLAARQGRIGSSAICTVAGLNPYETPLQLWAKMLGREPEEKENDAMWLGKELEPIVARMVSRQEPEIVFTKNVLTAVPEEESWMVATPDYHFTDGDLKGLLECKTTSAWGKPHWEQGVPDYAHCQVQWQMGIWGSPVAKVACLVGGRELIVHQVEFAKDVFEQLVYLGKKFMDMVKSETPPDARGADLEALKLLSTPVANKSIVMTKEAETLCADFVTQKAIRDAQRNLAKHTDDKIADIQARIIQLMGDAERIDGSSYEVLRKRSLRKAYQVKENWVERFTVKNLKTIGELEDDG